MPDKQSPDEIVSALFMAFIRLKSRLGYKNELLHLPLAQMETLRFIDEHQSVLMKQLAEFLTITPPSATSLVDNLSVAGYVKRTPDTIDRRAVHLTLTKTGRQTLQKIIKQRCKDLSRLLNNLSKSEQLTLLNILKRMTN